MKMTAWGHAKTHTGSYFRVALMAAALPVRPLAVNGDALRLSAC